ncbi:MAG: alpha/beta hydrolase family protein, partial [Gammaproteobacteria bacterium]
YISRPESVDFPSEGCDIAHALFYAPANPGFKGPDGEKPPVLVKLHGGPTAATGRGLDLSIQYWTSRGFAVVDMNYRGSTGYGRRYHEKLYGQWGEVDVDDCVNAVLWLAGDNKVDARRAAIRGGSAGGYTALAALAFRRFFAAGASLYGIGDLEVLVRDTHKFEARYLDQLIGPYPERASLYKARSPLHSAHKLEAPVIFFQGLDDKVVPPNQAEMMVDALKAKGVPVAYLSFEGEGHGFRKADTIERVLEAELYFYGRIFGFEPNDEIEPLEIMNLQ